MQCLIPWRLNTIYERTEIFKEENRSNIILCHLINNRIAYRSFSDSRTGAKTANMCFLRSYRTRWGGGKFGAPGASKMNTIPTKIQNDG